MAKLANVTRRMTRSRSFAGEELNNLVIESDKFPKKAGSGMERPMPTTCKFLGNILVRLNDFSAATDLPKPRDSVENPVASAPEVYFFIIIIIF